MSAPSTLPGFDNPVDDAQAVFRAALDALSRPGRLVPLTVLPAALPGSGLCRGLLALALTLCDQDTPLWLDAAADTPEARHHLRFHCGSPFVERNEEAAFAFISRPEDMPRLDSFNPGLAAFPERSATLLISANLSPDQRHGLELSGPGVKGADRGIWQRFCVSGLPDWFWADWDDNHAAYPLGVDIVFVDTQTNGQDTLAVRLLGLPRTVRVRKTASSSSSFAVKEGLACM